MTLVDTSVWIDFLRDAPGHSTDYVSRRLGGDEIATSEPVVMEVLAGARPGQHTQQLDRLLDSQRWHRVDPTVDYRAAVDVFHLTRRTGHQPRSLQDCLIAAVALRVEVAVAHRDADFAHIAAATGLRVVDLR